mgnify:FL=1
MGKLYGYARVSTKNQRLDRQIKNIEDYCKDNKIERIYREKYTGTKMERPQFKKLLSAIDSGDTIIFDSVSRMSLSTDEGYDLYMKLLQKGIDLIFIKEPHINTSYYKEMQCRNETLPEEQRKQIGQKKGATFETKKAKTMKERIQKMAKDFDGSMKDKEVIEILGISRNTYYKYKKELLSGGIKYVSTDVKNEY